MKSESLFYSYDSVFNLLPSILKQRGCTISTMNSKDGIIKAKRRGLFSRENGVNIKLDKIDNEITIITFWVTSENDIYKADILGESLFEEKLLSTLHKYF